MSHSSVDLLVEKIWNFHVLHQPLRKADVIMACGCNDTRVAERAAELYQLQFAPLVLFSGDRGAHTAESWDRAEAEIFADVAENLGVPREDMFIENKSTNTGENILFSRSLLLESGIDPATVILVHKPYMERRALAAFRKYWPGTEVIVTSPRVPFASYPTREISRDLVINAVVGDLQRIRVYGERGWSERQDIPADVWDAYEQLVALGYNERVMPDL